MHTGMGAEHLVITDILGPVIPVGRSLKIQDRGSSLPFEGPQPEAIWIQAIAIPESQ